MDVSAIHSYGFMGGSSGSKTFADRRADFDSLASALQANDLAGARDAFNVLHQDIHSFLHAVPGRGSNPTGTRQQDFLALRDALQSGNLRDAQRAFAALQQDFRTNHRRGDGAPSAGDPANGATMSLVDERTQVLDEQA